MLHWVFVPLASWFQGFNLFRYITFRAAFASVLAFLIVVVCGPGILSWLRDRRMQGCTDHDSAALGTMRASKQSVPTMGGLVLILAVAVSTLLLARLDNIYVVTTLFAFLAFGALGAFDDWRKIVRDGRKGLTERKKLLGQVGIAGVALLVLYVHAGGPVVRGPEVQPSPYVPHASVASLQGGSGGRIGPTEVSNPDADHRTDLQVPFAKHFCVDLGLLFLVFGALVIVGASNAVNLTDGLDGLAAGCVATTGITLAVVAYLVGRADTADYLYVFHIPGSGELSVFLGALVGACLGFLWFNAFPATVFMGDTGSLALGGALGLVAVATRHELTLLIAGGVFVVEAVSVILQRRYFKMTGGSRLFLCAPLHHHYQFQGHHEVKVTVRFWIVSILLAFLSIALLKLR